MTANVTSIAKLRAAARARNERRKVNNRTATVLLVLVVVLVVIGLGVTLSASSTVAFDQTEDNLFYFKRQLVGVGVGTVALLVAARVPYRLYRKLALPLFLLTVALLVAVLRVGIVSGGAQRWLAAPGFTFQPSELAKASVVFVLAFLLERKHRLLSQFGHFIVPVLATVGVVALLLVRQPDIGTMIIIGAAAMAVIMASDTPMRYVLLLGLVAVLVASYLAMDADNIGARVAAEAAARLAEVPGDFKVGLVVADDLLGIGTNRYDCEFAWRFGPRPLDSASAPLKRPRWLKDYWLQGVLWSSESPSERAVREAA